MNIKTSHTILRLRNSLQAISNISYSFSKLNQKYPIDTLTEANAQDIISAYKGLIADTNNIINNLTMNNYGESSKQK